ncbi:hypothetical protein CDAR_87951 [Caerostris darwini]|uniref:Uncharacterized protein n=1 Tax=Caerostris darwini TaxID=1538125 RepID=A0AAV4S6U6_9ARAC|nr:hypothetical protein CDAR_87951 [Caerostris darwini]
MEVSVFNLYERQKSKPRVIIRTVGDLQAYLADEKEYYTRAKRVNKHLDKVQARQKSKPKVIIRTVGDLQAYLADEKARYTHAKRANKRLNMKRTRFGLSKISLEYIFETDLNNRLMKSILWISSPSKQRFAPVSSQTYNSLLQIVVGLFGADTA